MWSLTKREIAATFGYAQPEHGVRVAVFGWPDCGLRGKIRWQGEGRVLGCVRYPGGPVVRDFEGERKKKKGAIGGAGGGGGEGAAGTGREGSAAGERTRLEGCIVVASSDENVKFHEVWMGRASGFLGNYAGGDGNGDRLGGGGFGGRGVLEGEIMGYGAEGRASWEGIR